MLHGRACSKHSSIKLPANTPRRQPFKKPRGWLTWGLLGMALSPAVVYVSAVLSEGLGASDAAGRGTVVSAQGGGGGPSCEGGLPLAAV